MTLRHIICACLAPCVKGESEVNTSGQPNLVSYSPQSLVHAACSRLLDEPSKALHSEGSWLSHIRGALCMCRDALGVSEIKFAIFSPSLAAWVLSDGDEYFKAEGWGSALGSVLEDQESSVVPVLLDYPSPQTSALPAHKYDTDRQQPRPCGPSSLDSLTFHQADLPLQLSPANLLVLPVRQGNRLAAALMLRFSEKTSAAAATAGAAVRPQPTGDTVRGFTGASKATGTFDFDEPWARVQAAANAAGASTHIVLDSSQLRDLRRLAQIVALRVLGPDPLHARYLKTVAGYLGMMPTREGLHDLILAVLDATAEILSDRFSIRLQPVLALTHGLHGGPAVLFTHRDAPQQLQLQQTQEMLLDTQTSILSTTDNTVAPTSCMGVGVGVGSSIMRTAASFRLAGEPSYGLGSVAGKTTASDVKAVKLTLPGTLLIEALRSTAKVLPSGGVNGVGRRAGGSFDSHLARYTSPPSLSFLPGGDGCSTPLSGGGCNPAQQQRFTTTVLRHASRHVLDEQQPCRDILMIGKLAGSGLGSLILCVEAPPAASAPCKSFDTSQTSASRAPPAATCHGSTAASNRTSALAGARHKSYLGLEPMAERGRAALVTPEAPLSDSTAANASSRAPGSTAPLPAAEPHQSSGLQPVFGLYLASDDVLPGTILQAIAAESKILFGLLLDSLRGVVSSDTRVASELGNLQAQLVDCSKLNTSPKPTAQWKALPHSLSLRKPKDALAINDVPPRPPGKVAAPDVPPRAEGQQQPQRNRTLFSSFHMLSGRSSLLTDLSPATLGQSVPWEVASSPELVLESAAGPSQLGLMVATMRLHLSTAVAEAEAVDEARNAMKHEIAALKIQSVIGRGGQGVVFKGLLHRLETAIKVTVSSGGESLDDGGTVGAGRHPAAASAGSGAAGSPARALLAAEEALRVHLRQAKRGAMEHAVTPTLSHPNIVQVYATFTNCVAAKCSHKGRSKPEVRLYTKEDAEAAGINTAGQLCQAICFEYCDAGTLLSAAQSGIFRPVGASQFVSLVWPNLVPLYTCLLEVALALRYLHARRLVHCDVKPSNVLLKGSSRDPRGWTCKLSDFGCARLMAVVPQPQQEGSPLGQSQTSGVAGSSSGGSAAVQQGGAPTALLGFKMAAPLGTLVFMAPESFVKDQLLTSAVDVYAFGIMMYELLTCQTPYISMEPQDIARHVRFHGRPKFHPLSPSAYCSLAARCWSPYPDQRPTACELVSELEKLLDKARQEQDAQQEEHSRVTVRRISPH